jgi:hypothetical protein
MLVCVQHAGMLATVFALLVLCQTTAASSVCPCARCAVAAQHAGKKANTVLVLSWTAQDDPTWKVQGIATLQADMVRCSENQNS